MKASFSFRMSNPLYKISLITIAWVLFSFFQFLIGYSLLYQRQCDQNNYDPIVLLEGSIFTGLVAGLIGAPILVFLWEKWLRDKTYGAAIARMFITYCLTFFVVSTISITFYSINEQNIAIFPSSVMEDIIQRLFDIKQVQTFIIWLFAVMATLLALQVNDKYGHGVFRSFLLGRYFHPKREERIFMFLDLRSSTTIAEKLGEVQYFNFIKEVFRDATPAIINAKGEIYQYVGDEIIISWKMEKGIESANCLKCFFDVQALMISRRDYYQKKYDGMMPEFKAGLHYGYVMAGEIGVVKRDIAYSGDVLNIASRIQAKCNELGVNILLSTPLIEKLNLEHKLFNPKKIGNIDLRGKQEKVVLFTV